MKTEQNQRQRHRYKCVDCGVYLDNGEWDRFREAARIRGDALQTLSDRVRLHHNHERHAGCCIHLVIDIMKEYAKLIGINKDKAVK